MYFIMENTFFWPALGLIAFYLWQRAPAPALKDVPTVKYHRFLPNFINRLLYYPKAISMISEGYQKYKDRPFRMLTADGEVYVLPMKYQKELRNLPHTKISSLEAQYQIALGRYTNILIDSEMPGMTVRKRLTPSLGRVVPRIIDELRGAFNTAFPEDGDTWVKVNPNAVFTRLIALATCRVIVGDVLRQNEQWLDHASSYAHNLGITLVLLRPVPAYLRPLVAFFLPTVWRMNHSLRLAKQLFVPIINERRQAEETNDPAYTKPDDFLQWIMDLAKDEGEDLTPNQLAHHMLILLSLAVTHTTTLALCHALYDLITMPQYLEPLREEMSRTLPDGWYKGTQAAFTEQVRLDSFLRESQRFAPSGELSFHRIVMCPVVLHDGLILPKGAHICFPGGPVSKDPENISRPMEFDGFRWCKDPKDRYALSPELAKPSEVNGNEPEKGDLISGPSAYVTITETHMGFGYGRQACPGRFFAANTIKAVLSRLILDYEFTFVDAEDRKRPANVLVGEHILPNMDTEIMVQKKPVHF